METTAVKKATTTRAPRSAMTTYAQVYQELSFFSSVTDHDTGWGIRGVLSDIEQYFMSPVKVTQYSITSSLSRCINENEEIVDGETLDKIFDDVYCIIGYVFAQWAK